MSTEDEGAGPEPASGSSTPPPPPDRPRRGAALAEIRDAVSLRTFVLVTATLALGLGFVISYVGALHDPRLQNAPVTVVSNSPRATAQIVSALNQQTGGAIAASAGTTEAAARAAVADRSTAAAYVYDAGGSQDTLIVATAAGSAQAAAIEKIFLQADEQSGRTLAVQNLVAAGTADFNGVSLFYLVVGWSVTGYLIAAILGLSSGSRPANLTRAVIRLVTLALCAFLAGLIGTLVVQQHVLGALSGQFWPMVATGTLLVFGVGAITMALQIAFGVAGIGLAVLLVVVLGNPSAGGAFPRSMLPPFWRAVGAFLPPGAGVDSVRSIVYFGGARTGYPLLILGGYALVGLLLTLLLSRILPSSRPAGRVAGAAGTADGDEAEGQAG